MTHEDVGNICVYVKDEWNDMFCGMYMQCLTHELNHAAMCILGQSGVYFNYENQEALCYLQDFLMRKCVDAINKSKVDTSE